MRRSDWCAAIVASGLLLGALACKGTGSVSGEADLVVLNGRFKAAWDNSTVAVHKTPSRCDVRFLDADGDEVGEGATGVGEGDLVAIPEGATHVEFSGPSSDSECTGCSSPDGWGSSGSPSSTSGGEPDRSSSRLPPLANSPASGQTMVKWLAVKTLDADIDGSTMLSNIDAFFLVETAVDASTAELHSRVAPILYGGHGTPPLEGVHIETYVRIQPERFGGRLVVADVTTSFETMELAWNGAPYADLDSNSSSYQAPHGWSVVEVFIPSTDFQTTLLGGSSNSMSLSVKTAEDEIQNVLQGSLAYW